jgi:hypothetical protein
MQELGTISIPIIYVHLGVFALLIPLILFADHEGLEWLRGKKETLNPKVIGAVHNLVWAGLIVMILSGLMLAWPLREALVVNVAFYAKVLFVLLLVVNSFFIGKFMHLATEKPFASLTSNERLPLILSGALSGIGWFGAFVSALLMGFGNVEGILRNIF